MNYLQMKKKAMLNYVQTSQEETMQIVTHATGSNASIDVTIGGVTTNYLYSQLSRTLDLGLLYLDYFVGEFRIRLKGNLTINDTQHSMLERITWGYGTSVDYTIKGHEEYQPHNKVRVVTQSTLNSNNNAVIISDEEENIIHFLNDATYSKAIQVYYQSGWKIKANQDIEYNGATYHNGDMVEQWAYNVNKDIDITIL